MPIDVQKMDCDWLDCSITKCAPTELAFVWQVGSAAVNACFGVVVVIADVLGPCHVCRFALQV